MKKIIFSLVLGIGIGSISTYFAVKPVQKSHTDLNSYKNLDYELADYIKLKDMRAKYEKADEILGKVMLLFVANLGIKMQPEVVNYFAKDSHDRTQIKPEKETLSTNQDSSEEVRTKALKGPSGNSYGAIDPSELKVPSHIENAAQRLSRKIISSPFSYLKKSKPLHDELIIEGLIGRFHGKIYVQKSDIKGEIHDVELDLNFFKNGPEYSGDFKSELSKNGIAYSTQRGSGSNKSIRVVDRNKLEIIIQTSPASFMQLFVMNNNKLYGNFYDNDEFIGIIELNRR